MAYSIAKFGQKLIASEVRYYIEFQEYPNTSETGFASVYNVSGWDEEKLFQWLIFNTPMEVMVTLAQ